MDKSVSYSVKIVVILSALSFLFSCVSLYLNLSSSLETRNKAQSESVSTTAGNDNGSSTTDLANTLKDTQSVKATMEKYVNSDWNVQLEYPGDWTLSKNPGTDTSVLVTVANGEYEFRLHLAGGDPGICDLQSGEYRTVADSERTYMLKVESNFGRQTVCEKETNSDTYVTWAQPGFISYAVPQDADPEMIKVMDEILLSYSTNP
ncbi:hypothetical protein KC622_02775 [Candidatus Dojkabacteria bacterium]|uniref:Lipoprotein n=1 Tax=Candidatus Dojkabacteria bacterium TaxID=2099670 RepID=A0A955KVL1_9BACT|nr:hypothetical protein [Candidatus Dojkabacteria bacterium]